MRRGAVRDLAPMLVERRRNDTTARGDSLTVARSERKAPPRKGLRLPESKGRELLGVGLLLLGLLLLLALGSFRPTDPSLFHRRTETAATHNLIGPVGAEIAALSFGLFGLPCLIVPVALLFFGARRLASRQVETVAGRGIGLLVVLASLPLLCHLVLGDLGWRGGEVRAGGVLGKVLGDQLTLRLGAVGAMLVALGSFVLGATLAVKTSWIDGLRGLLARGLGVAQRVWGVVVRHRERRLRERSRRQVIEKHVERARRLRDDAPSGAPEGAGSFVEGEPVRVLERPGEGAFSIRRVRSEGSTPTPMVDARTPQEPPREAPRGAVAVGATQQEGSRSTANRPATRAHLPGSALPVKTPARAVPQESLDFPVTTLPQLPPLNLLVLEEEKGPISESELIRMGDAICARCSEFGVEGVIEAITPGPVITVFELLPAPGVKVSHVVNLQDDLALSLRAESIRIDRIAGRSTLGIEVPNKKRSIIRLGPLLSQEAFRSSRSPLTMALGRTLQGEAYYGDLASMPHLLVAGATGAGKSVGLQSMITSILYKASRDQVQFIFIDPKRIELGVYADIPHLKAEVVVEPKKAANALRWAVAEMERRYRLLAEVHVRSIDFYNRAIQDPEVQRRLALKDEEPDSGSKNLLDDLKPLPYYVVVIDELADLMMVASSEVEQSIARLAQMARAVGIHLIVATQRPSVDVLTGTIKANFPCRMAFATASRHDSRTILDQVGSEKLLGKGDMLFLPPGSSRPIRLHGAYVSEQETAALIRWLKKQGPPCLDPRVVEAPVEDRASGSDVADTHDELFDEAARLVVSEGQGSASFLQRRMRVGFSRAARLIDLLEHDGILGPPQGSKPREVLVARDYFEAIERSER
jgi:S-DNA-T family DNA segregation ATPase FtsK/SpoIIIE